MRNGKIAEGSVWLYKVGKETEVFKTRPKHNNAANSSSLRSLSYGGEKNYLYTAKWNQVEAIEQKPAPLGPANVADPLIGPLGEGQWESQP